VSSGQSSANPAPASAREPLWDNATSALIRSIVGSAGVLMGGTVAGGTDGFGAADPRRASVSGGVHIG
jgi:hypothetical protein